MLFSSVKEANNLISEGMSNIHLKVTIEQNWRSQNFDFLCLKNSSPDQIFGSSMSLNFKTFWCNLKIRGLGAKACVAFVSF